MCDSTPAEWNVRDARIGAAGVSVAAWLMAWPLLDAAGVLYRRRHTPFACGPYGIWCMPTGEHRNWWQSFLFEMTTGRAAVVAFLACLILFAACWLVIGVASRKARESSSRLIAAHVGASSSEAGQ